MTILRLVGGTDVKPTAAPRTAPQLIGLASNTTSTAENGRLREKRKQAWREAEAATRYWRARLDFDDAVSFAQTMEIPEAADHPALDPNDRYSMVRRWREALAKQLLTPAPDTRSITWKRAVLAGRQFRHIGVKAERIERAIAEDLAFLAAHPVRQSIRRSAKAKDDGGAA
jgi:hypothetical protein